MLQRLAALIQDMAICDFASTRLSLKMTVRFTGASA